MPTDYTPLPKDNEYSSSDTFYTDSTRYTQYNPQRFTVGGVVFNWELNYDVKIIKRWWLKESNEFRFEYVICDPKYTGNSNYGQCWIDSLC